LIDGDKKNCIRKATLCIVLNVIYGGIFSFAMNVNILLKDSCGWRRRVGWLNLERYFMLIKFL